jgi:hypothetical protein
MRICFISDMYSIYTEKEREREREGEREREREERYHEGLQMRLIDPPQSHHLVDHQFTITKDLNVLGLHTAGVRRTVPTSTPTFATAAQNS